MDLGRETVKVIWARRIGSFLWWVLLVLNYLWAVASLWRISTALLHLGVPTFWEGGGLFILSSITLIVSILFLLVRGNQVFLGRGTGLGQYLDGYRRTAPRWVFIVNLVLLAGAIGLTVYVYSLGVVNVHVVARHGRYFIGNGPTARAISLERYRLIMQTASVYLPASAATIASVIGAIFVFGDKRAPFDATRHREDAT